MTDRKQAFVAGIVGALLVDLLLIGVAALAATSADGRELMAGVFGLEPASQAPVVDSAGNRDDVVNLVDAASPAVVSIVITKDVPIIERYYEQSPFGGFFGLVPQYREIGSERQEVGGGTGFLVSADGYLVTNAHVVADDDADYSALFNDGSTYDATVIAVDQAFDIALLKIEAGDNLAFLEFGDSDSVKAGQSVVAIGNALGEFRNTVSVGVISGVSRTIVATDGRGSSEELADVIQTDAAINPGNSGGPLLDLSGRVIGVNVAASGQAENIGFALPANDVKVTVESMRTHGRVIRPYLGVRFLAVTPSLQTLNELPVDYGALIIRGETRAELAIIPGSPADKAGLEENDIILEVDGVKVDVDNPLQNLLRRKIVGDEVQLLVLHDGAEQTVRVTLEEAP